ncbi:MAG: type II secretion system protein GspL [Gammaproteobacteria bacterium]
MPETLILRLGSSREQVDWVVIDATGQVGTTVHGSLADAAEHASGLRVMALAPTDSVLRVSANIPIKGTAKIRQALPFALEEQIAGDIDAQHFAFSKADNNGNIPVAVVEKSLMDEWLQQLYEAGLKPDSLRVESDGLPAPPATISILIEDTNVTIRDYEGEFIVTDTQSLEIVLDMLLDQHGASMERDASMVPVNIMVYANEYNHGQFAQLWERMRLRAETVDLRMLEADALPFLASQHMSRKSINLLQGPYESKTEFNIEWGPWRLPSALIAACLVLSLGLQGANYWQLTRTEAALDQAALKVLQTTFPDAESTSDPWNALQSRLGTSDNNASISISGPGFDETISVLAEAFKASSDLRMQTIAFRNGTLDLQLLAPDVSTLDKLRQLIVESGQFEATIQSANPDDDVIKGRMQITAVNQ